MMTNPHIGSSFDEFLEEEGILEEVRITALKRVLAWQLQQEMQKQGLTKSQMATAMGTSRASLNRLLDPDNTAVTLKTLERAATIVGKRLYITLADPEDLLPVLRLADMPIGSPPAPVPSANTLSSQAIRQQLGLEVSNPV